MLGRLLRSLAARLHAPESVDRVPALVQAGRHGEAERLLRRRLSRAPAEAGVLHLLGLVCLAGGRAAEAVTHLERAVAAEPSALFHSNLAEACRAAGRVDDAEAHAREAVARAPGDTVFALRLATLLAHTHRAAESLALARSVLERAPDSLDAALLAAGLEAAAYRAASAAALYEKAVALSPGHPGAQIGLYRARRWLCDWSGDAAAMPALLARWAAHPDDDAFAGLNPFVAYEVDVPQAVRDAVTQSCAARVIRNAGGRRFAPAAAPGPRIRLGYLSADFHNHPTMHLMRGLFALHDRRRFEVFAYSMGPDDGSAFRRDVVGEVDGFRDVQALGAADTAALIHADRVGILVDLKGYTHGARPEALAMKPAPVSVAWLGYPASTGRGIDDYIVADRTVLPPGSAAHFGECPAWLPHTYQINDDSQPIAAAPSRAELGLPETGFVFACFNHVYKIEPAVFASWMRILGRVPGSVLWLYADDATARANLCAEAGRRGIDPSRLLFAGTLDKPRHLARMACADLFLDTRLINAHTGASDALWAGLPVLTCPHEGFPSRVAASVLGAAGLARLVCDTPADYEDAAVRLALHPGELQGMREHLRAGRARLPLFDTARFTRNLERAYEAMWARHLAGEPPQAFAVSEAEG